jgi:hypothetical protein
LQSATGKPLAGRICEKPAPGIRSANGAAGVQHASAAAGATNHYQSLQWSQNQRPSQLTIQTKSSTAHQHLPQAPPPAVHWKPPASLGQHHAKPVGAQLGLHGAARLVRVDTGTTGTASTLLPAGNMCFHFKLLPSLHPHHWQGSESALPVLYSGTTCLHFSYPNSVRTRARRLVPVQCQCAVAFLGGQVCFEPLTRTNASCAVFLSKCALNL